MATPSMPMPPPPPTGMPPMGPTMDMPVMQQMAFFWGHRAQVLFSNWPGDRHGVGMYVLCLLVVALLAGLVEILSAASRGLSRLSRRRRDSGALWWSLLMMGTHVVKMGLAYLVMLAVMSFNGGVFLAVLTGHAGGFLLSRTVVSRRGMLSPVTERSEDVPTTNGGLHPSEPKP